jgi:predicted glycogen debranching enzyme
MRVIEFGSEICRDLERALTHEWLETNGIGGFASSTILCINTRRYHALLTAALGQPAGRFVLLSKLEATVVAAGAEYPLCSNIYPGAVYPAGFQFLRRFRLDPFPVFTFQAAGRVIEKRIVMARGENTVVAEYRLVSGEPCELLVRPLVAFRGYHETTHENTALSSAVTEHDDGVSIQPYAPLPRLFFSFTPGERLAQSDWYRNFVYPRESERGLDDREDLFSPFAWRMNLSGDAPARIVASTSAGRRASDAASIFENEARRRAGLRTSAACGDRLGATLLESADAFLIRRPNRTLTVVAGYHWFTDWGRDAMVSLPGLTLVTRRFDLGKQILGTWASLLDRGMLPNRFPDGGAAPEYNSVDAALWLFEAVRKYIDSTGDLAFVRSALYQPLLAIIDWYTRGTRFGIRCDQDGLIIAGAEGSQLTWMDALVAGRPATPRHGKPVEIQALWYNALCVGAWLAREFEDTDSERRLTAQSEQTVASFAARFWNQTAGCFFDVVDQPGSIASIRPNQVIALSLGFPLLEGDRAIQVLSVIERELLTPFGLRTLAPSDPHYRGTYEGGVEGRDGSYHQGTVWPWLLGHFISAYVRTYNRSPQAMERARSWLSAFEAHLSDAGLGSISEIFDGDSPHRPRGCIAQAWSVAEILRVYVEDAQ